MSLEDWLGNRWLTEHRTSTEEVNDLLEVIQRDLRESQLDGLSDDWSFNLAYSAALQTAKLALHASGYRAGREAHHERTIESLKYTLEIPQSHVRALQKFRRKRNVVAYDRVGTVTHQERDEIIAMAAELYQAVREWLQENYPEYAED